MANHKSAAKRARTSTRRATINSKTLSGVRTLEKKLRKVISGKNKDEAAKALLAYESSIAKAAQKGRVHFRTASRKIGRLHKAVNAI